MAKGARCCGREWIRRIRVLAIEDDPGRLALLNGVIRERRLPVDLRVVRASGDLVAETRDFRPDILYLNSDIGQFDGIAVVARIRRGAGTRPPKVIFNTALATGEFWAKALRAGADRCLPAPFRTEDFATILQDLAGYPDS